MKNLKFALCALMISLCATVYAQQILSTDMTITKPIYFMKMGDNALKLDPANDKCTLRFNTFGNGYISYELELEGPTIAEVCKAANMTENKLYYTWTGNTNRNLNAMKMSNNGYPFYMVATPSQKMDGMFAQSSDGWMILVTGQVKCITDVHSGMTVSQITDKLKGLIGNGISMKEVGTEGALKKYALYGARVQNNGVSRPAEFRVDDAYAFFYFDAEGKLAKWYMVKQW